MARLKHIDRWARLELSIPESILARVNLELYSELEGRVPYGKRSALIAELLKKWLKEERGVVL